MKTTTDRKRRNIGVAKTVTRNDLVLRAFSLCDPNPTLILLQELAQRVSEELIANRRQMKVASSKERARCLVIAKERIMDIEKAEALLALSRCQILVDLGRFRRRARACFRHAGGCW